MVAEAGVEPAVPGYEPGVLPPTLLRSKLLSFLPLEDEEVERLAGIEPGIPAQATRCSTTEATAASMAGRTGNDPVLRARQARVLPIHQRPSRLVEPRSYDLLTFCLQDRRSSH